MYTYIQTYIIYMYLLYIKYIIKNQSFFWDATLLTLCFVKKKNGRGGGNGGSGMDIMFYKILNSNILALC